MSVGISDIALYFPDFSISLEEIAKKRAEEDPHWVTRMPRALASTGQKHMRFPQFWEDPITMATEAAHSLLDRNPLLSQEDIRFIALGTETSVDMSKPGSNYVLGLLKKSGYRFSNRLTTYQIQHACAAGTLGILGVAGFLQAAGGPKESGLVLTSDIARYKAPSTAEVTQGAGASAILIEKAPKLISLELETAGFFAEDVDDFFRPLGSVEAKVKGGYSLQCYHQGFISAFEDHCRKAGRTPEEEIQSIDLWALHVPYSLMPLGAMLLLLKTHLGMEEAEAKAWLEDRHFFDSLEPASKIGNIYTGSLYLSLAWALSKAADREQKNLIGKKVLMASYGSGNTMVIITGQVQPSALETIENWSLQKQIETKTEATYPQYLTWLAEGKDSENLQNRIKECPPASGRFHLASIREDGYREYSF